MILSYGYDLICYTASKSEYADVVLDYIDKDKTLFSKRLYRQHCIKTKIDSDNVYVKDLRIFHEIALDDIVIIDNSALSFASHLDNGIPILPFYDNKNDNELLILANYLKELSTADDIRVTNRKFIKYDEYPESQSEDELNTLIMTEFSNLSESECEFSYLKLDTLENEKDNMKLSNIKKNYNEFQKSFMN